MDRHNVALAAAVEMIDVIDEDDTVLTRFNRTSLVLLEPISRKGVRSSPELRLA
jgi:hypothetical protein